MSLAEKSTLATFLRIFCAVTSWRGRAKRGKCHNFTNLLFRSRGRIGTKVSTFSKTIPVHTRTNSVRNLIMLGAFLHQFHPESPVSNTWCIMCFLCCIRRRLGCGRDSSAAARRPGTPDIDGGANFNGCGGCGAHTCCPSPEDSQHAAGSPLAPIKWLLRFYSLSGVIPGKKNSVNKKKYGINEKWTTHRMLLSRQLWLLNALVLQLHSLHRNLYPWKCLRVFW